MYIIMSKTVADIVTGVYNVNHQLKPCELKDGNWALPESVLYDEAFQSVFQVLDALENVDNIEVKNETE